MRNVFLAAMFGSAALLSCSHAAKADSVADQIKSLQAQLKKLEKQVAESKATPTVVTSVTDSKYVKKNFDWSGAQLGVVAGAGIQISPANLTYDASNADLVGVTSNGMESVIYEIAGLITAGLNDGDYPSSDEFSCSGGINCSEGDRVGSGSYSAAAAPTKFKNNKIAGLIGSEFGYAVQNGNVVIGLNADFTFMAKPNSDTWDNRGDVNTTATSTGYVDGEVDDVNENPIDIQIPAQQNETLTGNNRFAGDLSVAPSWLGTLRGTLGVAQDRALFFVTGGLAFGRVNGALDASYHEDLNYSCDSTTASLGGTSVSGCDDTNLSLTTDASWSERKSQNRFGFAIGGGVAYAISENTIFKVDGLYYNLGTFNLTAHGTGSYASNGGGGPWNGNLDSSNITDINVSHKVDGALARISVAYKFD